MFIFEIWVTKKPVTLSILMTPTDINQDTLRLVMLPEIGPATQTHRDTHETRQSGKTKTQHIHTHKQTSTRYNTVARPRYSTITNTNAHTHKKKSSYCPKGFCIFASTFGLLLMWICTYNINQFPYKSKSATENGISEKPLQERPWPVSPD